MTKNKRKKYLVIGDYVISATDGRRHFIPAHRLIKLYGLDQNDCICVDGRNPCFKYSLPKNLIELYPRYDGNYNLKKLK